MSSRLSDDSIRAMLDAFAGPAEPVLRPGNRRHAASRRTLIVAVAAVLALVAVPGSLALLGQFSETPREFINDTSEPVNVRNAVERFISRQHFNEALTGIRRVLIADTPAGEYRMYALTFSGGDEGVAIISSGTGGAAIFAGRPLPCPHGWALQASGTMGDYPGKTPLYISGRAADAVASIDVVYPDGHSTPAAVANGYFLAWVIPEPGAPNTGAFSQPVTLVARDAAGNELGQVPVGSDGDIRPAAGEAPGCG
jgi:hypothetical protein